MAKEDPDYLQSVPTPDSFDKRTFQEEYKLIVDTDTGDMYKFHPASYADKQTDPDTPR